MNLGIQLGFIFVFAFVLVSVLSDSAFEDSLEDGFQPVDLEDSTDENVKGNTDDRQGKFFSFYGFPKLESVLHHGKGNVRCTKDSGDKVKERHGVCAAKAKCRNLGGTDLERSCDPKFGFTCCQLNVTCDRSKDSLTVTRDYVYIRHETNQQECLTDYKFPKQSNVCQLRLEFKQFNLSPPNRTTAECLGDKLTIRKAENLRDNLILCGKANETDHLYLHYGESNEIIINLDVAQQPNYGEVEILVRQIKCNAPDLAPEGCTQYFTQQRGDVRSFNFDRDPLVGQQLNNHIYSVCVKGSEGSTSVTWSPCNGVDDFDIVSPPPPTSTFCTTDSITIPGSAGTKYCATGSLVAAETKAKPYLLYVHFDAQELVQIPPPPAGGGCPPPYWMPSEPETVPPTCVLSDNAPIPDIHNRGFCLRYHRT